MIITQLQVLAMFVSASRNSCCSIWATNSSPCYVCFMYCSTYYCLIFHCLVTCSVSTYLHFRIICVSHYADWYLFTWLQNRSWFKLLACWLQNLWRYQLCHHTPLVADFLSLKNGINSVPAWYHKRCFLFGYFKICQLVFILVHAHATYVCCSDMNCT
jgi:hypothetical protein